MIKEIITYETTDGQTFDTKGRAEFHQNILDAAIRIKIEWYKDTINYHNTLSFLFKNDPLGDSKKYLFSVYSPCDEDGYEHFLGLVHGRFDDVVRWVITNTDFYKLKVEPKENPENFGDITLAMVKEL